MGGGTYSVLSFVNNIIVLEGFDSSFFIIMWVSQSENLSVYVIHFLAIKLEKKRKKKVLIPGVLKPTLLLKRTLLKTLSPLQTSIYQQLRVCKRRTLF